MKQELEITQRELDEARRRLKMVLDEAETIVTRALRIAAPGLKPVICGVITRNIVASLRALGSA